MNCVLVTLAIVKQQLPANVTMPAHAAVILVIAIKANAVVTQANVANY